MTTSQDKALANYRAKRDFRRTREPSGQTESGADGRLFVIQKHAARNLHYDFRLELDGTLKSWAVPKGPSLDPDSKRLAVQVEDHPLDYADFEGEIPAGEYGGGTVLVWDRGTWEPQGDAAAGYRKGHLSFELHGEKLRGRWSLVRMHGRGAGQWLLIKARDDYASDLDILEAAPESVISGRGLDAIRAAVDTPPAGKSPKRRTSNQATRPRAGDKAPPRDFKPQLATLTTEVPRGEDWLHEIKYDGYRVLAIRRRGRLRLVSRNGLDWTEGLPRLARACAALAADDFILDGELVVQDDTGVSDFQALQTALHDEDDSGLVYFGFDLPYADGQDLRRQPLLDRKGRLQALLRDADPMLRYSDHVQGHGPEVLTQACQRGLEGIVSKRVAATYAARRNRDWLKIKCSQRQEFVIGGYTEPGGTRNGFGALLLGYYAGRQLQYAGRVGTGFSDRVLKDLCARLRDLEVTEPAFAQPPTGREAQGVHWCRPELVGEVSFTGWTRDGRLRHPAFQGLREDKPARAVVREHPAPGSSAAPQVAPARPKRAKSDLPKTRTGRGSSPSVEVAGVRISHPDRVLFPDQGVTKVELAEYYAQVADQLLPYIVDRPLSLVRCPRGRQQSCFYQKHLTEALPDAVEGVEIEEQNKRSTYIVIRDRVGLISLVQFGTLELHPWPARTDRLDRPDLLVFDLDPGEGVTFKQVVAGARRLREDLQQVDLRSFVRTSGGKGLHVVVPLERRHTWNTLRDFAEAFARLLALGEPDRFIATASKAKRRGRIFIDYLRNSRGATSIANYSTRARPGAPVAVPLRWDELGRLKSADQYTIRTLPRRLAALKEDPWADFEASRQRLPKL